MAETKPISRTSIDPGAEKKEPTPRAGRAPKGDPFTLDLFSGEPFGAKPAITKLSKAERATLEKVLSTGEPFREAEFCASPPEGLSTGATSSALARLVHLGMLRWENPRLALMDRSELRLAPTESARLWLRNTRDAEAQKAPTPPRAPKKPDPATVDAFLGGAPRMPQDARSPGTTPPPPPPGRSSTTEAPGPAERPFSTSDQTWVLGRVRWVARHNPQFRAIDIWTQEVRRQPHDEWEVSLMAWGLSQAERRGWVRKVVDVYHSQIVEVRS